MFSLTQKQIEVRDLKALDLLVSAPAGCGKTEALALRIQGLIQRGDVDVPKRILVTTFSNRARDNIKDRLRHYLSPSEMRNRVTVLNFHGLAARVIRSHANVIGLSDDLLFPENDWIGEQLRRRNVPLNEQEVIQNLLREIKQQPLTDSEVVAKLQSAGNILALELEQLRSEEGRLTYDDLPRLAELILNNECVADLYAMHFGAVVVDEFQDLTLQQLRIINRIGYKRTTFGGDRAQGIYSFAGARPIEVDKAVRTECTNVIEFSESHRSSPAVIETVNALTPITLGQKLSSAHPDSWPSGGLSGAINHQSPTEEAEWIVKVSRAILRWVPNHRIGVLSRTASRRKFVDEAFAKVDVPQFRWDDALLDTDTAKLVKAMLARFDLVAYSASQDRVSFLRSAVGFEAITEVDTRKNLVEALDWVHDLLAQSESPEAIRERIKAGDSMNLITNPGVHLLSGHLGKGQQFDWVIVVGLEEGSIPFFKATTPDEIREEARVLSVMISRARHGVILSRAVSFPTNLGYPRHRSPSSFLKSVYDAGALGEPEVISWFRQLDWSAVAKI